MATDMPIPYTPFLNGLLTILCEFILILSSCVATCVSYLIPIYQQSLIVYLVNFDLLTDLFVIIPNSLISCACVTKAS